MTSEQKQLDSRLNELLSFTAWLEANLPTISEQTDEDTRMMLTELDSVLEWYEQEIMRQIEGRPADELYFEFLTLTSLKAMFIRMDLLNVTLTLRTISQPMNLKTLHKPSSNIC
jgi:hypothetical protein